MKTLSRICRSHRRFRLFVVVALGGFLVVFTFVAKAQAENSSVIAEQASDRLDAWTVKSADEVSGFRDLLEARANAKKFLSEFNVSTSHWKLYAYQPDVLVENCGKWIEDKPRFYDYPIGVMALVIHQDDHHTNVIEDADNVASAPLNLIAIPLGEERAANFVVNWRQNDDSLDQTQQDPVQSTTPEGTAEIVDVPTQNWQPLDERRQGQPTSSMSAQSKIESDEDRRAAQHLGVEFICENFGDEGASRHWGDYYVATGTPVYDWRVSKRFIPASPTVYRAESPDFGG